MGQRLQLALAAGKIGTWELELPGRVLTCSAQCKANFGRAADACFSYEDLLGSIDPADRPGQEATVLAAIASGENFSMEYRCVWPDGSRHWIEVSGAVVRGTDVEPARGGAGVALVLAGVTQEITERKRTENDLRDARGRITSMLEAADVGSWTVDLISDRVTPDRNLIRIFYLTDEEAHGSMGNYLRRIHPEDRPGVDAAIAKVVADPLAKYALEYRVVSRAGEQRWIDIRGAVERDAAGQPVLFRGVVLDITHRKHAEEQERLALAEVAKAAERFGILADAMPQMVWSARADGFLDYYNQRWFDYTGLTLEETQGWGWKQVQHPEDVQGSIDRWNHSVATGDVYERENRFLRASDGAWRWHFTRAVPVLQEDGSVAQWIGTCTDIHDRKEAEEALRESRQVLETRIQERTNELFQEVLERRKAESDLRDLSARLLTLRDGEQRRIARELHDSVGQYMAAALMSLNAIDRRAELSAPGKEALAEAIDTVQQASKEVRVVSYLLHPPLLDELGLTSAIHFYLEGFSQRSGIETKFSVAQDFGRLPIDVETALFRVCQESLTNIHRHSGSKVAEIRLRRLDGRVELEIADQGTGIPAANVLGVGLRGLRERIGQFAGTMKIESNGGGTTVRVGLPLGE